jgi:hypothetical protein
MTRYKAKAWTDEPGRFLYGGSKQVESIWYDREQDAQDWLTQCVEINSARYPNFVVHGRIVTGQTMPKFRLVWSPEGREIAIVSARSAKSARRKAPQPFRKYLGEIYVEQI